LDSGNDFLLRYFLLSKNQIEKLFQMIGSGAIKIPSVHADNYFGNL